MTPFKSIRNVAYNAGPRCTIARCPHPAMLRKLGRCLVHAQPRMKKGAK